MQESEEKKRNPAARLAFPTKGHGRRRISGSRDKLSASKLQKAFTSRWKLMSRLFPLPSTGERLRRQKKKKIACFFFNGSLLAARSVSLHRQQTKKTPADGDAPRWAPRGKEVSPTPTTPAPAAPPLSAAQISTPAVNAARHRFCPNDANC